ncbi:hypothetical protein AVEN_235976-1 [Araneus ventricosus]|uniref:CCHC-type domain-containing protein n=1 Tax=Araneus ventricosus TaxID=182803 RepID=A0A4Y2SXA5_ARAVE|nr:hypothetical protein AVEN_235976-1 [Araneus ventricosus]
MMEASIPDIDTMLNSPSKEELNNAIKIVSTHPSPFEELSLRTMAAMTKIRTTLSRAKVTKSNKRGVLEGATALLALLYEQANEIGTLNAKIALLEAKTKESEDLKEQCTLLKAEKASLLEEKASLVQAAIHKHPSPSAQVQPTKGTFADQVKKWTLPKKQKPKFVSLIYPKDGETSSEEVKSQLYSSIAPSKFNVNVKNVKKLQNGGVAVECSTEDQLQKIMTEINSNKELQEKLEAKRPALKLPKVIIYDVEANFPKENLLQTISQQNEVDIKQMKLLFQIKSKTKDKCHWVLETEPEALRKLLKARKVALEWTRLTVREFLRPTKCYKCCRYGHISINCKEEETCPRCGNTGHKRADCDKEEKCVNCIDLNKKFQLTIDTSHDSTDPNCEAHIREMKQLRNRTKYV